mmetsp:Transcript_40147/g.119647  ORF Transcript_40147/g.119647 Transcript_40147/m.119647 type:complete len:120 (+) Transcript_40147:121-480(+)|eukprot:356902-Chlamydomonas_euryale.AAC.15
MHRMGSAAQTRSMQCRISAHACMPLPRAGPIAGNRLGHLGKCDTAALSTAALAAMSAASQQLGVQLAAACAPDRAAVERCTAAANKARQAAQDAAKEGKLVSKTSGSGGEKGKATAAVQ